MSQHFKAVLGPDLKENVVIRDYVTTAVGGIVDYLMVCDTIDCGCHIVANYYIFLEIGA